MLDLPRSDRVRDAFTELTDSVDPFVAPPGADSVLETVRRRRQRRLAGAAATALAVAAVVALVRLPLLDRPAVQQAGPPPAVVTTTPAMVRPPFAPPTAAPTTPPGTRAAATVAPTGDRAVVPATSAPQNRPLDAPDDPTPCTSRVTATATGTKLVISAGPVCPGDEIAVSWATYEARRDGSQKLFASERHTLTEADPRLTTTLRESPKCVGPWYALRADPPIPATIAADEFDPFPAGTVLASGDGEICLS